MTPQDKADNALFRAGLKGDIEGVKKALSNGANINLIKRIPDKKEVRFKAYKYSTVLLESVDSQSIEFVKGLLELGADPNIGIHHRNQAPAIFKAVMYMRLDIVKLFLDHGVKVKPELGISMLCYVIKKINNEKLKEEFIKILVENGIELDCENKEYWVDPLIEAIRLGDIKTAKYFLSLINNQTKKTFSSRLFINAIDSENMDMVKLLCSNDIFPHMLDPNYPSILNSALNLRNISLFKYLIPEIIPLNNISHSQHKNKTMLQKTIICEERDKYPERTRYLIQCGADIREPDADGLLPFFYAIDYFRFKAADLLIENGVSVNEQDKNGKTALMCCRDKEQIDFLLERGADINIRDNDGKTALMHIYSNTCQGYGFLPYLINNGASVDVPDNDGNTMMTCIVEKFLDEYGRDSKKNLDDKTLLSRLSDFSSVIFAPGGLSEIQQNKDYLNRLAMDGVKQYINGMFFIVAAAALLPEHDDFVDRYISKTLATSFKKFLCFDELPVGMSASNFLEAVSVGKKGAFNLEDSILAERLIGIMQSALDENPGVVVEFVKKRIGKKLQQWIDLGWNGTEDLAVKLVPFLKKEVSEETLDALEYLDF